MCVLFHVVRVDKALEALVRSVGNFDLRFRPTRDFELQEVTPIRCPGGSAAADNALQPRGPGPTRLRGTVRSDWLSLLSPVRLRVV